LLLSNLKPFLATTGVVNTELRVAVWVMRVLLAPRPLEVVRFFLFFLFLLFLLFLLLILLLLLMLLLLFPLLLFPVGILRSALTQSILTCDESGTRSGYRGGRGLDVAPRGHLGVAGLAVAWIVLLAVLCVLLTEQLTGGIIILACDKSGAVGRERGGESGGRIRSVAPFWYRNSLVPRLAVPREVL